MKENSDEHRDWEICKEDIENGHSEGLNSTFGSSWSVQDDKMFAPIGLMNHGSALSKTVFALWSDNYLLNFIFKRSRETKKVSMKKVRIAIPAQEVQDESEIIEILVLKFNTLILMKSGRVYYFSSVKTMRIVPWISGVRCISKSQEGFSVIRVMEDNNAFILEVYGDAVNLCKAQSTLKQRFDITFYDFNIFNCQWPEEKFSLLTQTLTAENLKFMESLIRKPGSLQCNTDLHVFAVMGNVFILVPNEGEISGETNNCDIHRLASYASCVEFIKIHYGHMICLVLLQCGIIDIWYISGITQRAQHIHYNIGTQYIYYDFSQVSATFFYTDERKVACLDFSYDGDKDLYYVQERCKLIGGIQVCTWVEGVHQLVCLSCNNIFYQFNFDSTSITSSNLTAVMPYKDINKMYEITPENISNMLQKGNVINDLLRMPKFVHENIEKEYLKQQLITVANRSHIYKKLFVATLQFMSHLYSMEESNTIILYMNNSCFLRDSKIFALINLKITKHAIVETTLWSLRVNYDNKVHTFIIPSSIFFNNICIVIPLLINATQLPIFPAFILNLSSLIRNNTDFLCISLPVEVQVNSNTYFNLFNIAPTNLSIFNDYSLQNLIANYNRKDEMGNVNNEEYLMSHTLQLQKSCNFETISKIFQIGKNLMTIHELTLYFLSHKLAIKYNTLQNSILLQSKSPLALYYAKLYLYYNLEVIYKSLNVHDDGFDHTEILQLIMQYQSGIEHCYGTNLCINNDNVGMNDDIRSKTYSGHFEILKANYINLRTKLCHSF